MAEYRAVDYRVNAEQYTQIAAITGAEKLNAAIGYLVQWNMTHPRVIIYVAGGAGIELVAVYIRADDTSAYAIGAVWHKDHFGFHS